MTFDDLSKVKVTIYRFINALDFNYFSVYFVKTEAFPFSVTCKKKSTKRTMWSEEEKKAVHQFLGKFFVSAKLPGKALCLEAKSKAAVLSHRPWQQIKFYIKNHKVVWDSQYIQQLDNPVWLNFDDIRQYILLCVTHYSTRISVKYVILNHRKCYVQR